MDAVIYAFFQQLPFIIITIIYLILVPIIILITRKIVRNSIISLAPAEAQATIKEKDISLKKAKKFIERGKPGKAIAEIESILDHDSSDSTAKDLLEECYKKYGKE